jgi:hypothetical protein
MLEGTFPTDSNDDLWEAYSSSWWGEVCSFSRQKTRVTVVSASTLLEMASWPWCISISRQHKASPMPIPPWSRERWESAGVNILPRCSTTSSSIPAPVSRIRSRMASAPTSAAISTRPPAGVNLMALERRFSRTCRPYDTQFGSTTSWAIRRRASEPPANWLVNRPRSGIQSAGRGLSSLDRFTIVIVLIRDCFSSHRVPWIGAAARSCPGSERQDVPSLSDWQLQWRQRVTLTIASPCCRA